MGSVCLHSMTSNLLQHHNCMEWHQLHQLIVWIKIQRVRCIIYHYNDVIMTTMASQITSLSVVYSNVYSDANQRKHQSSASLAFVWGIHRDRWIPRTKGQLRGKCFHLMTSTWMIYGSNRGPTVSSDIIICAKTTPTLKISDQIEGLGCTFAL